MRSRWLGNRSRRCHSWDHPSSSAPCCCKYADKLQSKQTRRSTTVLSGRRGQPGLLGPRFPRLRRCLSLEVALEQFSLPYTSPCFAVLWPAPTNRLSFNGSNWSPLGWRPPPRGPRCPRCPPVDPGGSASPGLRVGKNFPPGSCWAWPVPLRDVSLLRPRPLRSTWLLAPLVIARCPRADTPSPPRSWVHLTPLYSLAGINGSPPFAVDSSPPPLTATPTTNSSSDRGVG